MSSVFHGGAGTAAVSAVVILLTLLAADVPYPSKIGAFKKLIVDGLVVCHQREVNGLDGIVV